jgi:26S proteasome regulatory subunit N10
LALKHRQNKSQRQRIIVFVCSPVDDDEKKLVSLAKKMKKSGINIDFVLFGDLDDDEVQQKLEAFNNVVKGNEESHLVVIPPSGKLLSDQLIASPIMLGSNAGAGGSGGMESGGDAGGDFGGFDFDPSADPELALALRMSMEEENARQARQAQADENAANKTNLEGIQEEGENQPLLDKDGEASGSSKKDKDDDRMDTS